MAEKWRRCEKCRKVKSVDDFEGDTPRCQPCEQPVVRRTTRKSAPVTTRVATPAAGESATAVIRTPVRDLRGRGDMEVRARRARVRALDRLAQTYAEEFESLLAEERRAEGL